MHSRTDWTDAGQIWAYKVKATELVIDQVQVQVSTLDGKTYWKG